MSDYQCPSCKSDRVWIDDNLNMRCSACGLTENLEDYPINRADPPSYATPEQLQELGDRIQNVEELVAHPGGVPWQFHHQLQQIKGELAYLRTKTLVEKIKPPPKAKTGFKEIEV